ncbi:hypothetical protein ACLMJK_008266 [Lecanora helva]
MAGHTQGRGQAYSYQQSQSQQANSPTSTQCSATTGSQKNSCVETTTPKPKLRTSCDGCQTAKLGCSQEKPTCRRCLRHGIQCVYSPFRRIGRPRKSITTRSNNSNASKKSQSKEDHVEARAEFKSEDLPDLETDNSPISTFFESLPAPPSSPVSLGAGQDAWYPWTPDGDSLYNGLYMNSDSPVSTDLFPSSTDYLDMGTSFDSHHNMLMSSRDEMMLDFGPAMQPTPPLSATPEMMQFAEPIPELPESKGLNIFFDQNVQPSPPSSVSSSIPSFNQGTMHPSLTQLNAPRSHPSILYSGQQLSSIPPKTQILGPTPELTPPLSANSSPAPSSSCSQRCSSLLIQHFASLENLLEDPNRSLDSVLEREQDAVSQCAKLVNCSACINSKRCSLLFAMVIEQIMRLLETIPSTGSSNACSLTLGHFEADGETKNTFLNRYLSTRLSDFAGVLKEFATMVADGDEDDSSLSTSRDKVRVVYQRLETLKLELGLKFYA